MPRVNLRLPADLVEAIKQQPDYEPAQNGRTGGGVTGWIAALVARELGTERRDYHAEKSAYWAAQRKDSE